MCDRAVGSARLVLLQAFNTKTTKNLGAARRGSDDKSPHAVLRQPGVEIDQQAETQAAHAEVGRDLRVVRRYHVRDGFDCRDQLPIHQDVPTNPSSGWKPTLGAIGDCPDVQGLWLGRRESRRPEPRVDTRAWHSLPVHDGQHLKPAIGAHP